MKIKTRNLGSKRLAKEKPNDWGESLPQKQEKRPGTARTGCIAVATAG